MEKKLCTTRFCFSFFSFWVHVDFFGSGKLYLDIFSTAIGRSSFHRCVPNRGGPRMSTLYGVKVKDIEGIIIEVLYSRYVHNRALSGRDITVIVI